MVLGLKCDGKKQTIDNEKDFKKYFSFKGVWIELRDVIKGGKKPWYKALKIILNCNEPILTELENIVSGEGGEREYTNEKAYKEWYERNKEKIDEITNGISLGEKGTGLINLFIAMHYSADCDIMAKADDRKNCESWKEEGWSGKSSVDIMREEIYRASFEKLKENAYSELIDIPSEETRLDLKYTGEADGRAVAVAISKSGRESALVTIGDQERTIFPGEKLYALRLNGKFECFIPRVRVSGMRYIVNENGHLEHREVKEDGSVEVRDFTFLALCGEAMSWDFDAERGGIIVIDTKNAIGSVRYDRQCDKGVMALCNSSGYKILLPDGSFEGNCEEAVERLSDSVLEEMGIDKNEIDEGAYSESLFVYRTKTDKEWKAVQR